MNNSTKTIVYTFIHFDFVRVSFLFFDYSVMRYATKCFLDNTNDCDPYLAAALNPLLQQTLDNFEGRCLDTWCPLKEIPKLCDVQKADECVSQLQDMVTNGAEGACMYVPPLVICNNILEYLMNWEHFIYYLELVIIDFVVTRTYLSSIVQDY